MHIVLISDFLLSKQLMDVLWGFDGLSELLFAELFLGEYHENIFFQELQGEEILFSSAVLLV